MFSLNHYQPTRVVFGNNALNEIVKIIQTYGNNVFIVCSNSFPARKESNLLFSLLEKSGIHYEVFNEVTTNPTEDVIRKGATALKKMQSSVIISVGGGSVHDAAKAMKLQYSHSSDGLIDYTVTGKYSVPGISNNMIPHITVPTISGTGAEVSPASLVRIENQKHIIYSPFLYPIACIVDTDLFTCQDEETISRVGVDAFYQGLECFLANNSNPFSDMFALSTVVSCLKYLPALVKDTNDDSLKQLVELASINSIKGVSNAGVGAIHALSDPLSGQFNVHHGVAETIVAKSVINHYIEKKVEKINLLEKHLYQSFITTNKDFPLMFVQQFDWFLSKLVINTTDDIKAIRTKGYNMDSLVAESNNPDMGTAPIHLSNLDIASIFKQSL
ncbi:MAG: iron-containing alcohol dehydrogenase [Bacteroidales bacterium]|nr:iron-containing alcohol dehydrogenase [Bacteroidales bacterium]